MERPVELLENVPPLQKEGETKWDIRVNLRIKPFESKHLQPRMASARMPGSLELSILNIRLAPQDDLEQY